MEMTNWPINFFLSLVLGALIGFEREINERKDHLFDSKKGKRFAVLGLRSFSLISGLGAITGLLAGQFLAIAVALCAIFGGLLLVFYMIDSHATRDFGITTETALLYTFLLGFLIAVGIVPQQILIVVTVMLILLLSRKDQIKRVVEDVTHHEVNAFVSFAILAFVILPFLPNQAYSLNNIPSLGMFLSNLGLSSNVFAELELFNPFKLWFIVVLITGVDLLGYVLERIMGNRRGWLVASLVGGFVSSTATTISIAQESKTSTHHEPLLSAAILATAVSFFPILFLLATLNIQLFISFLPILLIITLTSLGLGIYFLKGKKKSSPALKQKKVAHNHHIFDLFSALKFVGIYMTINIISKVSLLLFGNTGFLVTTALGALTGIDAVVINTAQLVNQRISVDLGIWALLLANSINLLAKSAYCFVQGRRQFAIKYLVSMLIIIAVSIISTIVL